MSRKTEDRAKTYLIKEYKHSTYRFLDRNVEEKGFDLWMQDKHSGKRIRVELKASESNYQTQSDIFKNLVFSAEQEVEHFMEGRTTIVRVFLGNKPPRVFAFDKSILKAGATVSQEYRARLKGSKNYDAIQEIVSRSGTSRVAEAT